MQASPCLSHMELVDWIILPISSVMEHWSEDLSAEEAHARAGLGGRPLQTARLPS
jgi:hypothetical protein